MQKRDWLKAIAALCCGTFLVTACGATNGNGSGSSQTGDVIKIGVTGPLSGNYANAGTDLVNAAKVAAKDINSKGGLLGKQVEIIPQDDQCDAQVGVQAAQKLSDQHVNAVVGGYCSGASIPESGVFHTNNIPFVAVASTNPKFTEQGFDNVFRTIGRDDQQGPFAGKFISEYLHAKTVAVIDDNTTYSKGLAEQLVNTLKKAGVNVVYYNAITPGEKDYTSVLTKVKFLNPDVIYYSGLFPEAGILVKQARQLNIKATFMGSDGTSDPTLIKTAGDAANGMIITAAPLPQFMNDAKGFMSEYKSTFNRDAGPFSAYEYDGVTAVANAIKSDKSADPQSIIKALHSLQKFTGLTGDISFNPKGDRESLVFITILVKDQAFQPYMKSDGNGNWVPVK